MDEHISYQLPKLKSISNWVQGKKFINIKIKWNARNSKVQPKKYKQKIDNNIHNNEIVTQEQIDAILDKISQYGYDSLTEREKKILYEASKKLR